MEQQANDNINIQTRRRPVFLTILCILSFIGIMYAISTSIHNVIITSAGENIIEKHAMGKGIFNQSIDVSGISDYNSVFKTYNIICVAAAIVCLVGVVLIWRLKRLGFYIYAVGEIAPVLTFFILFGGYFQNPLLSVKFMLSAVLMFLIAFAFITMYAMNYKRLS